MILSKKKCLQIVRKDVQQFFLVKLFVIVLVSSETHFDLFASKIGAKLNNLVFYMMTFWSIF